MRFKDVQCVYCDKIFTENDDVVVCPQCGSPHHRECWKENGCCKNEQLHEEGFEWKFPEHLKPVISLKREQPSSPEAAYKFKNGESAIACPHCGSLNYGFDAVCMQCKQPLNDNRIAPDDEATAQLSPEQRFEYYRQFGGLKPDTVIASVKAEDYAAYIGKNAGRYIRKFAVMERFGKRFSVSLCAFLFGPIWFFYRKLWKEGLLFLLSLLVLTGIGTYCSLTEPMKVYLNDYAEVFADTVTVMLETNTFEQKDMDEYNRKLTELAKAYESSEFSQTDKIKNTCSIVLSYASLALSFVMSLCADVLYKKKIKKDIAAMQKSYENDEPSYKKALSAKGGVSVPGAVIGVVSAVAVTLVNFLPTVIALADKF